MYAIVDIAGQQFKVEAGVLPLADALRLVTTTPARELALDRKGRIEPGCDADLVVFDDRLSVRCVFARGKRVE